jgi:TRAP-type uncharacterized transport system substrate-binding protein
VNVPQDNPCESLLDELLAEYLRRVDAGEVVDREAFRRQHADVARDLEAICLKCMAKDPYRRYGSAQEVEQDLGRCLAGDPVRAKPLGAVTRAWNWIRDVPLVAALIGRSFAGTTSWHHRAQRTVLSLPLAVLLIVLAIRQLPARLPEVIAIGAGEPEGMYDDFCHALSARHRQSPVTIAIQQTQGSIDNLRMLRHGKVHVALAQVETLRSPEVVVVAPLFREVVHLLSRVDGGAKTMAELKRRWAGPAPPIVWLGRERSGMRVSAEAVVSRYGIDVRAASIVDCPLEQVAGETRIALAVVTAGPRHAPLQTLLASGEFRLISLPETDRRFAGHPSFRHHTIRTDGLPAAWADGPATEAIETVATVSVWAVRRDESDLLVTTLLDLLYLDDQLRQRYGLIPRTDAVAWMRILTTHRAARDFFLRAPGQSSDLPGGGLPGKRQPASLARSSDRHPVPALRDRFLEQI